MKKKIDRQLAEDGIVKDELANANPKNVLISLAKTMAVVALTSRIWNPNAPLPHPFSADTRAVQEDLLSSIRIILNRERIGSDIEEELRNLLAPVSCFKQALTRWLFEFLMECQ